MSVMVATTSASTLAGCNSSQHSSTPSVTTIPSGGTTTVPNALWQGQARAWFALHGPDLKAISTWANNLGKAAKAGNGRLAQIAVTQFLIAVGRGDDDLPSNAFGNDLHAVFADYATALALIRSGLLNNDEKQYRQGTNALGAAVAKFGAISARLKTTP